MNEPDGYGDAVRPALALINQVLDEVLSRAGGRLRRGYALVPGVVQGYGFEPGPFGVAETAARRRRTRRSPAWSGRRADSGAGRCACFRSRISRPTMTRLDARVSEWEIVLHLAKRLREQGADAAARLMAAARPWWTWMRSGSWPTCCFRSRRSAAGPSRAAV